MRDIPIIFSATMVLALLREVQKPGTGKTMTRRLLWKKRHHEDNFKNPLTPWGDVKSGDRLWVRETWKPHSLYAGMKPREMPKSKVFFAADNQYAPSNTPWVTPIHMPRWASRMTLIVTATKIDRLQDITHADAKAEGLEWVSPAYGVKGISSSWSADPIVAFCALWRDLYGPDAWDENPEVVAIAFRPVLANIDALAKEAA